MAPLATKVTTARVQNIKLGEYDQVFALTQKMINDALEKKFLTVTRDPKSKLLETLVAERTGVGKIIGKLGYPRVAIKASYDKNLTSVNYILYFTGGRCKVQWEKPDTGSVKQQEDEFSLSSTGTLEEKIYEIKDWCIAFHLLLGLTKVESESEDFGRVVGSHLAGQYDLNELVAKFETATYDESASFFGTTDWSKEEEGARESFKTLVTEQKVKILSYVKETGTIGFALKPKTEKAELTPKLTFDPCEIQYQTYPWTRPQSSADEPLYGLKGDAQLNYLLYCEVTKNPNGTARELPLWKNRFLDQRMGNWTDGVMQAQPGQEATDFGSFHMARANFFDAYLLPKLRVLNSALEPTLTYVRVRIEGSANPDSYWDMDLKIGHLRGRSTSDCYYDFKPVAGKRNEWEFASACGPLLDEDTASFLAGSSKVKYEAAVSCKNKISFEPGSDIVTIKGSSKVILKVYYYDKATFEDKYEFNIIKDYEISWTLTLNLEAVSDGGLQIASTFEQPKVILQPNVAMDQESQIGNASFLPEVQFYLNEAHEVAMNNIKVIANDLVDDLAGTQGLCLPATGVFCFKNPILGHDGDLICSIEYVDKVSSKDMLDPNVDVKVNNDTSKERTKPQTIHHQNPPAPPGEQKIEHLSMNRALKVCRR